MKYLKKFNESRTELTESEIKLFFHSDNIKMNPDGSVDILDDSQVNLNDFFNQFDFDKTRIPIKFGRIKGSVLYIGDSRNGGKLTSLEGSPIECGGQFSLLRPSITDLKGAPKYVNGTFAVVGTETLTSLEGGPIEVGGDYECQATGITSLEGIPRVINVNLNCNKTKIRDFRGGPEVVGGSLFAAKCNLTSLEGLPNQIGGELYFTNEEVWDPSPLRNVNIGLDIRGGGRIRHLLNFFFRIYGSTVVSTSEDIFFTHYIAYQRFIQSLDYNWVKGSSQDPKIDLFRLREAMNEFDIDLVEMLRGFDKYHNSIGPYKYVGLDGERINIFGDRI